MSTAALAIPPTAATTATFTTRQFRAGNSQAVRIPAALAFAPQTEVKVHREGNKIIIEPKEETLECLLPLLAEVGKYHSGLRPEFEAEERDWS